MLQICCVIMREESKFLVEGDVHAHSWLPIYAVKAHQPQDQQHVVQEAKAW